jgi:hypothetical protein
VHAAAATAGSCCGEATAAKLLAAYEAAVQRAKQALQQQEAPSREALEAVEKALSLATDVAAGAERAWTASEQAAQQRLELARAAATRSCAYLACANLAGEGGPAAGEGKGSLRCSGCKTAWYCGAVCSHADWREGGHRRVCKALAAERAARP